MSFLFEFVKKENFDFEESPVCFTRKQTKDHIKDNPKQIIFYTFGNQSFERNLFARVRELDYESGRC